MSEFELMWELMWELIMIRPCPELASLMLVMLYSCSEARFRGENSQHYDSGLRCQVTAETAIGAGQPLLISVTSHHGYRGEVIQTINGDGLEDQKRLFYRDGHFYPQGLTNNGFTANHPGLYTIELRTHADEEAVAHCMIEVPGPQCSKQEKLIGVNIAFIIDNSNSNSLTDCPGPRHLGKYASGHLNAVDLFECQAATVREQAVLSTYDFLEQWQASATAFEPSQVSVASFPGLKGSDQDYQMTGSWLTVGSDVATRQTLKDRLGFVRRPFGLTPFRGALMAAHQLWNEVARDDQRPTVVVIVTDGEPTDQNPREVIELAHELKKHNVKIVTVFNYDHLPHHERQKAHISMMERANHRYMQQGARWYERSIFNSFEQYISELIGTDGRPGLILEISSKQEAACQDSNESICPRSVIEVPDFSRLSSVLQQIVQSELYCE